LPPSADDVKDLGQDAGARVEPGGPEHTVVLIHARWAESWIRTEHVGGELTLGLSAPLRAGAVQTIEESSLSEYREGSLGWVSVSAVAGTVTVMAIDGDSVTLKLALVGRKKGRRENGKPKEEALVDTVEAPAVASVRACYFGD
jgi:hypothetical protein